MKKLRLTFALAAIMTAAISISCEKEGQTGNGTQEEQDGKQEEQGLPVAGKVNTYIINGKEYSFGSTALSSLGTSVCIAATPTQGLSELTDIMTMSEYQFFGAISPEMYGRESDLKTETAAFNFYFALPGLTVYPMNPIATGATDAISEGKCEIASADGVLTFKASMKFTDGNTLALNIMAEEAVDDGGDEEIENVFGWGEDVYVEIVSSAFVQGEKNSTITFSLADGKAVDITMPTEYFFDEEAHELSEGSGISMTYEGNTISKAGSVSILVDTEAGMAEAEFTDFEACELYYIGECIIR